MNTNTIIELFNQIQQKGWWGSVTFEFKKGAMTGTHVVQSIRQHNFEADQILLIVSGEPEKNQATFSVNGA